MKEHHFVTTRTARYFTLGNSTPDTREIILVVHGYAQLASSFLETFVSLQAPHRVIIAPEGLSRFYAKGFGGQPAASWMTSEDRQSEINDYIHFLESLMAQLVPAGYSGKLFALGFSQGVATVTRWMAQSSFKVDHLFVCSGQIATELCNPIHPCLRATPITYITGTQDALLNEATKKTVEEFMNTVQARIIRFEGGHVLPEAVIRRLF